MNLDDFKKEASATFFGGASEWFKQQVSSVTQPKAQAAPAQPAVIIQSLPPTIGGLEQRTVIIIAAVALVGVAGFLMLSKKGRK